MGVKTVSILAAELERRISQLTPAAAVEAINRALAEVHDSGSYTFDLLGSTGSVPTSLSLVDAATGVYTLPSDCDTKKAILVSNVNGLPVVKEGIHKLWMSFGYNLTAQSYSTFTIAGRDLLLRPGTLGNIGVRYHLLFVDLTGGQTTRLSPQLDQLVIDLAEVKERRIHNVGAVEVWSKLHEETLAKIMKALDGYLSVTMEQMPLLEAASVVQEATHLGRA